METRKRGNKGRLRRQKREGQVDRSNRKGEMGETISLLSTEKKGGKRSRFSVFDGNGGARTRVGKKERGKEDAGTKEGGVHRAWIKNCQKDGEKREGVFSLGEEEEKK